MAVKYQNIWINPRTTSKVGRSVTNALKGSFPGQESKTSNVIIQWGQAIKFQKHKIMIVWDNGYFNRERHDGMNRHFRLSINEYHPTNLPPAPQDRFNKLGLKLENLYNPNGHILLVGLGRKTRALFNTNKPKWELQALAKLRAAFPDRKIIYRPKKMENESLPGAVTDSVSSIRDLCKGCSLIYTMRSNVGNEGILYGIPVISEGGPAADVCPSEIVPWLKPLSTKTRQDFLNRLCYWQWSINEMYSREMWDWLMGQIDDMKCRG